MAVAGAACTTGQSPPFYRIDPTMPMCVGRLRLWSQTPSVRLCGAGPDRRSSAGEIRSGAGAPRPIRTFAPHGIRRAPMVQASGAQAGRCDRASAAHAEQRAISCPDARASRRLASLGCIWTYAITSTASTSYRKMAVNRLRFCCNSRRRSRCSGARANRGIFARDRSGSQPPLKRQAKVLLAKIVLCAAGTACERSQAIETDKPAL